MKNDSKQTMVLIGVALLVVAGILLYISLRQPKIYEEAPVTTVSESAYETSGVQIAQEEEEITESNNNAPAEVITTQGNNGSYNADSGTKSVEVKYPLNINKATIEELMTIDGLGETRAGAIIEYREYLGGYTSVEQITEIKGIDESLYVQIAGYLTV